MALPRPQGGGGSEPKCTREATGVEPESPAGEQLQGSRRGGEREVALLSPTHFCLPFQAGVLSFKKLFSEIREGLTGIFLIRLCLGTVWGLFVFGGTRDRAFTMNYVLSLPIILETGSC